MAKKEIIWASSIARPKVPIAHAVRFGNLVFTSGFVAQDPKTGEFSGGSVQEQTTRILETLRAVLEEAGTSLANTLKVNCYLTNIGDFAAFNDVYKRYFGENLAARTTVQIARLAGEYALEIEIVAGIPDAKV
jgi:2-iminobutanoate/2-iminopropanoate deaminase